MRTKVYGKRARGAGAGAGVFDVFTLEGGLRAEGVGVGGVGEEKREMKGRKGENVLQEKPRNLVQRVARVETGKGDDDGVKAKALSGAEKKEKQRCELTASVDEDQCIKRPPRPRGRPRKSPIVVPEREQDAPAQPSSLQSISAAEELAPLLQQTLTLASPPREPSNARTRTTTTLKPNPNPASKSNAPSPPPATAPPPTRATTSRTRPTPTIQPNPPTPPFPHALLTHLAPLLACKSVSPTPTAFPTWTSLRHSLHFHKIGEGSFGEVYRARAGAASCVLKLIPLNAATGPGSRAFTSVAAAASEVRLLERMQRVPGFVAFRGACVVVGQMPGVLVEEWVRWRGEGGEGGSRDPRRRGAYKGEGQAWLVLEMGDAGEALEGELKSETRGGGWGGVERAWDVFWQTVLALAKAEVYTEFEHRDLHLGNICVRDTGSDARGYIGHSHPHPHHPRRLPPVESGMIARGQKPFFGVRNTGVEVTIIDYSLSRARGTGEGEGEGEAEVLFTDFLEGGAGPGGILGGVGDAQYDVYRYMAEEMGGEGGKGCKAYRPKTNVLWLAYLVGKLLEGVGEVGEVEEGEVGERDGMVTRTRRMREVLEMVSGALRFEDRAGWGVGSAGALVEWGVREGWFREEEVLGG